jgi:serine/threonine protein kinase
MAPEVLRGQSYTPASDIYSFSMIMWELTSGVPPFNNRAHDLQLALSICEGERPKIIKNTPQCYINLMERCWNEDPSERLTASEVLNIIREWIYPKRNETKNDIVKFLEASIRNEITTGLHPQAQYTSRLLNFTSKQLNVILKTECLDCVIE